MYELVVIDYGAGNLRSVGKALEAVGQAPLITNDPHDVAEAQAVVLPGVGAAGQIMRALHERGLDDAVRRYIESGRPFLGVCMGMQVLMEWSDEDGGQPCLGVIGGKVHRLDGGMKVPHMGWNSVRQRLAHPLWHGIPDESYCYFVHSYVVEPADDAVVAGESDYAGPFTSAIASENLFGTQFHPEKSGKTGLQLYRNFVQWALK